MELAAILFVLAGGGGLLMAGLRLSGRPYPPLWLALGHGAIAVAGLIALIYAAMTQTLPTAGMIALFMFVGTALGGITLLTLFHLRGKALPIPIMLGHGALGAASLVTLLVAIYG